MNIPFDFIDFLGYNSRPFKSKFVPRDIWDKLDNYRNDLFNVDKLLKKYRISVKYIESNGNLWVRNGEYDSVDDRIYLYLKGNRCEHSDKLWFNFKFELIKIILHEMIHQHQNTKRDFQDLTGNYSYFDHPDEVYAHAHCVYLEMTINVTSLDTVLSRLSESHTYSLYIDRESLPELIRSVDRWSRKYESAHLNYLNSKQ